MSERPEPPEDDEADGLDKDGRDDELDEEDDQPFSLDDVDPETWHAGVPWRPPLSLVAMLAALPVVSLVVRGMVGERLAAEAPDQLWLLGVWDAFIAIAMAAGAILLLLVPIAVRLARGDDGRIQWLLDHGFRAGVVLVTIVVGLHTILAAGLALAVERLVIGTAFPGTTGLILLAGLASATYLATTGLGALRDQASDEPAVVLGRADAPRLYDLLHDLAARIGVDPPATILLSPTMEFSVSSGAVRTIDGDVRGPTLMVSIPQMALLSIAHVEAILAHELAHIRHGDLEIGARMAPAFARIGRSIETLDTESRGLGKVVATPALRWLEFARDALGTAIAERRRASEAAADAVAATTCGGTGLAEGLLVSEAIEAISDGWSAEFGEVLDSGDGDPVAAFVAGARASLVEVTAEDVLIASLESMGPTHPAILSRIRAVGQADAGFALPERPALADLVVDPPAHVGRIMAALRARDERLDRLALNPPRVTPGAIGWLIAGVVFGVIITYRWVTATAGIGDLVQIALVIAGLWLLFPVVYPLLQHEAEIDAREIRVRPWWWRWLDADGERLPWRTLRWTDGMSLSVGMETWLTLGNGSTTISWWGGLWPKGERDRLYDLLRDRGAGVAFTSAFGDTDPDRHAVVWYTGDRLLVPEVKLVADGKLMEMRPVKVLGLGTLKLSFALIDRLQDPVEAATPRDAGADIDHLAELAEMDRPTFEREARRLTIDGTRQAWTLRIDDDDGGEWVVDRKVDKGDLDDIVFDILGIEKRIRAPRRGKRSEAEDPPADEGQAP